MSPPKGGGATPTNQRGTPATVAAAKARIAFTLHPYEADDHGDSSYGEAAADALGVPRDRVFKTLVAEVDGAPTVGVPRMFVGVVPVAATLDLKGLAAAAGAKKARMADVRDAERATGYVAGGISPLGQRRRLPMVIDDSISGFDTVFVSAGRRGLQIELSPADLIKLTGATIAAIARRKTP